MTKASDLLVAALSRAASIAATSIFRMSIIAANARFASAPPAAVASVSTRGVICQETWAGVFLLHWTPSCREPTQEAKSGSTGTLRRPYTIAA